jgi:hypothetical protein
MEYKVICIRVNVGENIENTITTKLNSYSNQGWDLF